jgi:hypothetical protein
MMAKAMKTKLITKIRTVKILPTRFMYDLSCLTERESFLSRGKTPGH